MYDVTALGELLIDLVPVYSKTEGKFLYEKNPGGAPANVLAMVSKLGGNTAFIGKVGEDSFGEFLEETLKELNIETKGLIKDKGLNTTLAFVDLDKRGERTFNFYRNSCADVNINKEELKYELIDNSRSFHFGSVSMTQEPSKEATQTAVLYAKNSNKLISYDPNLRLPLWPSKEKAREEILSMLPYVDILKLSKEELDFITFSSDIDYGIKSLEKEYGNKLIFVTLGEEGSIFKYNNKLEHIKGYKVNTIDTTGCGDSFMGSILFKILNSHKTIKDLSLLELMEIGSFGNASGALTSIKRGGMYSLPTLEEINNLRNIGRTL